MNAESQTLISFFERVAQKDEVLLKKLSSQLCFCVSQQHWRFSLPGLYLFLQFQNDIFSRMDYRQFRQLIFNSSIHKNVKLFGAKIIIVDNKGKVDKSTYALVWCTKI